MSGNTIVRFNLRWDNRKTSFRGRAFADVKAVPALAQWVLSLPAPTGQMALLAAYLRSSNEALEKRPAADAAAVVYRLAPDGAAQRALVDVDEMAALIAAHGKEHAMAGGLRCERGHPMKFVPAHGRGGATVRAHFSHVAPPGASRGGGGGGGDNGGVGPGGCSDAHLLAAKLLEKNVGRIQLKRFKACGECVEFAFGPSPQAVAVLEVSARNDEGGRIRSDVAVYERGAKVMTLEVRKAHKTDPASRAGVPYLEVRAGHVIAALGGEGAAATSRLNCENSDAPCSRNCVGRRAEAAAERAWKRKRRGGCDECDGTGVFGGEDCFMCAGTGDRKLNPLLCDHCDGTGVFGGEGCFMCTGDW
jgi:hypothetical protein